MIIITKDWIITLGSGLDKHEGDKITRDTTFSITRNVHQVTYFSSK